MSRISYHLRTLSFIGLKLLSVGCLCAFNASAFAQSTTIAFASCIDDEKPNHPIWKVLIDAKPNVTIFMGDNVYLNLTKLNSNSTIDDFVADYKRLESTTGFQEIRKASQILAIWDDNDYGQRDGDGSFELKGVSKQKFLDFWKIDPNSARANRPGNYDSVWIGEGEQKIQIILTDTRYFRSTWKRDSSAAECASGNIIPADDEDATMLGDAQWSWLEAELKKPAALHVIVSGIQVIPEDHCFERWAGFPRERQKLLKLISQVNGRTVILSGDRHLAETSRLQPNDEIDIDNEILEFTSSSLTSRFGWGTGEQNRHRVTEDNIRVNNFGLLRVDWEQKAIEVKYLDEKGAILQDYQTSILLPHDER